MLPPSDLSLSDLLPSEVPPSIGSAPSGEGAPEDRYLSDGQVVALALGVWVGAVVAVAVPMVAALALAAVARWRRWSWLLVLAVVAGAAGRGAAAERAWQPVAPSAYAGPVTLVGDPSPRGAGWRCEVRLPSGSRVEATGYGATGFDLSELTAGDTVTASGRLTPMDDSPWARARHLEGRLALDGLGPATGPTGPRAVVEWVRSAVAAGADPLPERLRPLYLGLVIGDDRLQPEAQQARFRAAGLSHLLAVSGQNVAFLLAVARPLVHRTGRRTRLVLTLVLLVGFAVATRAEPSVLRATATAGAAAWAATGGHRQGGLRLLALAVAGLVLIDPFLVWSVGFQLSVAASAGILVLGPGLVGVLPGPAPVRESLAVTLAAQLAVLPLLLGYFGPVSTAAVPANLLAGWAAGAVMTWGLTVGVVAGALPSPLAEALQLPATALTLWLDGVAAWAARLPAPLLDRHLALAGLGALAVAAAGRRWRWFGWGRAGSGRAGPVAAGLVALTLGAALGAAPHPPVAPAALDGGALWLPGGQGRPSVLVLTPEADADLLDTVLQRRITAVDVVVTVRGGAGAAALVRSVTEVTAVGEILAPPRHRVKGARSVTGPTTVIAAGAAVTLRPDGDRLEVTVTALSAGPGPP